MNQTKNKPKHVSKEQNSTKENRHREQRKSLIHKFTIQHDALPIGIEFILSRWRQVNISRRIKMKLCRARRRHAAATSPARRAAAASSATHYVLLALADGNTAT